LKKYIQKHFLKPSVITKRFSGKNSKQKVKDKRFDNFFPIFETNFSSGLQFSDTFFRKKKVRRKIVFINFFELKNNQFLLIHAKEEEKNAQLVFSAVRDESK
jgi:hypothetical protein